jgi:hypothetical protein
MWLSLFILLLNVGYVGAAPLVAEVKLRRARTDAVELYVGELARRAIIPKKRFVEIVYTDSVGSCVHVEGQVVSMNDSTILLGAHGRIPILQITRILVGRTKADLERGKLRLTGTNVFPRSLTPGRRYVQMGFGGLVADDGIDAATIHFLAGWELLHYNFVGLLGEIGIASPLNASERTLGTASTNLVLHLIDEPTLLDPYLTVGGTWIFRSGFAEGVNVGVGLSALSRDGIDLRFEVKDYIRWGYHLLEFRVGIGF